MGVAAVALLREWPPERRECACWRALLDISAVCAVLWAGTAAVNEEDIGGCGWVETQRE
jgi:hypothetical protein